MGIDEEILEAVREHGWQLISISDVDPPFLYSVGFMPQHSEAIIFGLDSNTASILLGAIGRSVKSGEVFEHKSIHDVDTESIPSFNKVAIRNVHPTQIPLHFGFAMGYARLSEFDDVQAIQVFWPDAQGKFPFDVGCDESVYDLQPRLDIGLTAREVAAWERQWE